MAVSAKASSAHEGRLGFTGHQTFPFRYGWLKKAVDAVSKDPALLRSDESLVVLGVGKNMVESIRHWGLATQVLTESDRGRVLRVSVWGKLLFTDGHDPYLEDPGSLWLLHWLLVTNPARAATWHLTFNHFPYPEFRKDTLATFIMRSVERNAIRANSRTIDRDIDCFVRAYTLSRSASRDLLEDSFNCPMVELGIIQPQQDGVTYQFAIGPKATLPVEIFGIVLLHHFDLVGGNRQSLSLQDCLYGVNSPGQVFKLDEPSLVEFIEELQDLTGGAIAVDETAGLKQLYRRRRIEAEELLTRYYRVRAR